jgi:phenylacetate-CoA ligase
MNYIVKNIFFPVHEYIKGHSTLSQVRELERVQDLTPQEIRHIQESKLQAFIEHVNEHVPYYRHLFSKNSSLTDIPMLTKKQIRDNTKRLCSERAHGLQRSNTGGSTGEPLIFYLGKRRISADVAAKLRATRWWGVDIGDREAVIWGSPVELSKQDRMRQFRDRVFRTKLLSAFDMTEETMLGYLNFIKTFRPLHVFGYPSSIYLLCKYSRARNIRLDDIGVKVIFCTAEKLYDYQRHLISDIFSAPVANGYGGRDSGFIAHECPNGTMHITDENIIVEIVDKNGSLLPTGTAGEIVVTHLESHEFPFLRYKTGDIGILSDDQCQCGRGLSILKSVEGRSTDFIVTSKGKIMHGLALIYVVRDIEGVKEFKIVQEDYDKIKLFLSVNETFTEYAEEIIREGFKKRLGKSVVIDIVYKDRISPERSGKFRYVESMVKV